MVEDFESKTHKAVTFVVGKGKQEWNEQKLPKALPGYSGGRLPGRSTEEKGREEGEECEGSKQRQKKNEIIEEVIRNSQRMVWEGQNPQTKMGLLADTENEKEEESWHEGDQMAGQWEEEQHLENIVERKRMEGSSLKLDVMQKVPDLVVSKRMSQGGERHERKEESARMVHAVEEDTEEMKRWTSKPG